MAPKRKGRGKGRLPAAQDTNDDEQTQSLFIAEETEAARLVGPLGLEPSGDDDEEEPPRKKSKAGGPVKPAQKNHGKNHGKCDECGNDMIGAKHKSPNDKSKQWCRSCYQKVVKPCGKCFNCHNDIFGVRTRAPDTTKEEDKWLCKKCYNRAIRDRTGSFGECDHCHKEIVGRRLRTLDTDEEKWWCRKCHDKLSIIPLGECDNCHNEILGQRRRAPDTAEEEEVEEEKWWCRNCYQTVALGKCDHCQNDIGVGNRLRDPTATEEEEKWLCKKCHNQARKNMPLGKCDNCHNEIFGQRQRPPNTNDEKWVCRKCYGKATQIVSSGKCDVCSSEMFGTRYRVPGTEEERWSCKKCYYEGYNQKLNDKLRRTGLQLTITQVLTGSGLGNGLDEQHPGASGDTDDQDGSDFQGGEGDEGGEDDGLESTLMAESDVHDQADQCEDCDRLASDEWHGNVCKHCHLRRQTSNAERRARNRTLRGLLVDNQRLDHVQLRELAHRHARILHPLDASIVDANEQIEIGGRYWYRRNRDLNLDLRHRRNIGMLYWLSNVDMIYLLQLDDAFNGMVPRVRPGGTTEFGNMHAGTVIERAKAADLKNTNVTYQKALKFLLSARPPSSFIQALDVSAAAALRLMVDDFITSLPQGQASTTHNGGIVGRQDTIERLQDALLHDFFPSPTSSVGLLCGAYALENALLATRRHHHRSNRPQRINAGQLMRLLFTNIDAAGPNVRGMMTTGFDQYFRNQMHNVPAWQHQQERNNMTRMRDLDIQQVAAMLQLAYEANLIEENYSLGLVVSAHIDSQGRSQPARVTIEHEGTNHTVFLHLNMAFRGYGYNHFEGFDQTFDADDVMEYASEWGLQVAWSGDLPREPLGLGEETKETELEQIHRQHNIAAGTHRSRLNAWIKACITCRDRKKSSSCNGTSKNCDNCVEAGLECRWDERRQARDHWKTGNEWDPIQQSYFAIPLG
ncbi:hypothetical protein LTR86_000854 [Recurvomyces mirabilis]|nr:hypothetical protein LTR86_000854 [Recurvomyces mirabilis]